MSGLLGDGWESEQSQMMLGLAQGLLSARGGAGLAAGLGNMQGVQQRQNNNKLVNAQLRNYDSEIEARKLAGVKDARQQSLIESMFGPMGGESGALGVPPIAGPGSVPGMPGGAPQSGGPNLIQMAKQLGIPEQAIQADMVFNGGKKISELFAERSKPNWQNVNGNLVNTNAQGFSGGLQPGMSASADGKVTAWQPDGQGGLVVGAPTGARETYASFKNVDALIGAAGRVNLRKNADGTESPVSELDENPTLRRVLGGSPRASAGAGEPAMKATVSTMSSDAAGNLAAIRREIKTTQNDLMKRMDANSKAMLREHLADLRRQEKDPRNIKAAALEPALATGTPTYGMTSEQAAAAKAAETKQVATAQADVVRDTGKQKDGKLYGQLTAGLDRAISLLQSGPTASGFGSMVDGATKFIGQSTPGADVASQLETVAGWLTANVPRMEGPQSDKDVQSYRIMAAEVGDRTKPVSQRLAAAKELQGLQAKYAELNGGAANTGGATGSFDSKPASTSQPFPANASAKNLTKGQAYTLPNGVEAVWDGMRFKGK